MGAAASHRGEREQAAGIEQEAVENGYKPFVERSKHGFVDVVVSSQSGRRQGIMISYHAQLFNAQI